MTSRNGDSESKDVVQSHKNLDLAFAMDCTGSMGSYIFQAQQSIRSIVEEIVSKESADVRLALVEYRDHPPQEHSFVTKTNDFTESVRKMKGWLDQCSACGGGDGPEAVADALHQVLKLNWRDDATKICVFIADAPPHGLSAGGDGFPNGCPDGLDPMRITNQLAEKGITIYMVGCEPSITPYRDFFMALTHITGGQYVPLSRATVLPKVIIGGAQEEISLEQLREEVNQEVIQELENEDVNTIDEEAIAKKVHIKMAARGAKSKQLHCNAASLPPPSPAARNLTHYDSMGDVKTHFAPLACPSLPRMDWSDSMLPPPPPRPLPRPSDMGSPPCMTGMWPSPPTSGDRPPPPPPPPPGGAPPPPPMSRRTCIPPPPSSRSSRPAMPGMACYGSAPPPPPPPSSVGPAAPPPPMCALAPSVSDAPESYDVVEEDLCFAQTSRMVSQAIFKNKMQHKLKKAT